MRLLKMILKATGKKGVPQGGVISPLISNVYLNEIDKMLEKAIETTCYKQYTAVQYARFADDLVVLVDSHARHSWIVPALKKRTAALAKLRDIFRRHASQPVGRVIERINPILRGWVNYFAVGHAGRCFTFIKDWVEKKIRRHLMRARKRKGSAGSNGVRSGSTTNSVCSTTIEFAEVDLSRKLHQHDRSHNP